MYSEAFALYFRPHRREFAIHKKTKASSWGSALVGAGAWTQLELMEHAANGLVEAPLKSMLRMKDLLLCVHVAVKRFGTITGNFTMLFGRLRQRIL